MKLMLTRHGETIENKLHVLMGQLPGKLTKKGIKEAKQLAKKLKKEKIDVIFSSDLLRASQTAKEIAKYHPDVPLVLSKNLRERAFNEYEGKNVKKIANFYDRNDIESKNSLLKRTKTFLNKLKSYSNKNILVVGHGGSLAALMANILDKPFDEIDKMTKFYNTGLTVFDPVPSLTLLDSITHLKAKGQN